MLKVYLLRLMLVSAVLIMVSCLFLSFLLISSLITVDWLAACIAQRVVGAVFVVVPRRSVKFAQSASQWEAKADT